MITLHSPANAAGRLRQATTPPVAVRDKINQLICCAGYSDGLRNVANFEFKVDPRLASELNSISSVLEDLNPACVTVTVYAPTGLFQKSMNRRQWL